MIDGRELETSQILTLQKVENFFTSIFLIIIFFNFLYYNLTQVDPKVKLFFHFFFQCLADSGENIGFAFGFHNEGDLL